MQQIPQQLVTGNLELLARQVVEGFIIGLHKSPFHGFSVEFAEYRQYNPGDSLKYIDWKIFGRKDKMFVKKFEEETNLRCCIAIDRSSSMFFPVSSFNKLQYSCISAAAIMQLLKKQLDATGLVLFDHEIKELLPVKSSHRHYKTMITALEKALQARPERETTDLPRMLHQIAEIMHQRSLVIVFSDFLENIAKEQEFYAAIQHLRHCKHEVIVFHVGDGKKEWNFEFENRPYQFIDMESGNKIKLQPGEVKEHYLNQINTYRKRLYDNCLKYKVDFVECDINEDYNLVLQRYLLKRNKMM